MDQKLLLTVAWVAVLAVLLTLGSVASYLRLLMRRLTPVGARKVFGPSEKGLSRPNRERVGVSISALHGAAMHLFAVGLTGLLIWRSPDHLWSALGTAFIIVLAAVAIADQLIPFMLVARHDEPEVILARWEVAMRRAVLGALPLTFPILISTTVARLLESTDPEPEPPSPEENLVELINTGEQEGLIEKGDRELLQSVVKFGDKVVREVMTPRPEIAALDINSSVEDLRGLFRTKRLTRYPVYSGQMDHIEGFVSVRDLMELSPEEQKRTTLRALLRPVPFVPETKPLQDLLKELQQSTTQMAIVIDEYGSVTGLITIEDLVEQIVGDIRDEVEPHARDIIKESESSYILAGHADLAEVAGEVQVPLEGDDYSTVAGLVMNQLGHLPVAGEKVESHGLTFEVLEANQRTVLKVRMVIPPAPPAP
ncbi:MAG TPA: hemolysin family protein, partial [Terriglobia bacterium]|nr:hemolysin family protein [Terriglobia bacterium]